MKISCALFSAAIVLTLSACSHKKEHKDSQVNSRIDSLVMVRTAEMYQKADEDLDQRMSVEVKPKADSIVRARITKDSVLH